jgi:ribonucleoside-diphosphate reductase alpha chain
MLKTGEPGFSIDTGANAGETLRNACTEISSFDDSDICNLGSLNMARIKTLEDMEVCVEVATAMLVAGSVYSDVPYEKVYKIREKNRRLGLGLMGIHEWLITNDRPYGPDTDLEEYLKIYERSTEIAHKYEAKWNLSKSVKIRAMAPCGSIGILAETTTSLESLISVAYKRRYLNKTTWEHQYVVETVAKRLIEEEGVKPESIEDAYSISPERRVAFQAWFQKYVDHGISSTINLPAWGSEANNEDKVKDFGNMLIKYLPQLRGITCYPTGARSGQPLTPISYKTAMKHEGEIFVESLDICDLSHGGTCGA